MQPKHFSFSRVQLVEQSDCLSLLLGFDEAILRPAGVVVLERRFQGYRVVLIVRAETFAGVAEDLDDAVNHLGLPHGQMHQVRHLVERQLPADSSLHLGGSVTPLVD